jgi:hypothetical protein
MSTSETSLNRQRDFITRASEIAQSDSNYCAPPFLPGVFPLAYFLRLYASFCHARLLSAEQGSFVPLVLITVLR